MKFLGIVWQKESDIDDAYADLPTMIDHRLKPGTFRIVSSRVVWFVFKALIPVLDWFERHGSKEAKKPYD